MILVSYILNGIMFEMFRKKFLSSKSPRKYFFYIYANIVKKNRKTQKLLYSVNIRIIFEILDDTSIHY